MNREAGIQAAYEACQRAAKRHYENFPVASLLVPRAQRDALAAIYAFARGADDFADEPGIDSRLERLADWRRRLYECPDGRSDHPVFLALGDAIRTYDLSLVNLDHLICAFESDVTTSRHQDFDSLLSYCRHSANPVGRLVLELFGHREPELIAYSDSICTALQLTNFWQDIRIDLERDRIYLPLNDLDRFGLSVDDLKRQLASNRNWSATEFGERWCGLIAFEVERTWELFENGKPLPDRVLPELRRQLRLTWLTGTTILDRVEKVHYEVFRRRPKLRLHDFIRLYFRARHPLMPESAEQAGVEVGSGQP